MRYSFSELEIILIIKRLEKGEDFDALCKEYKISSNLLNSWKVKYSGLDGLQTRLAELEEENYKLKGTLADIRIRKEADDTGDTDRIYRILAASIPGTAITILDREERYLLAEGDFLATMGYVKETMPGKKISDIITPENYNGYYKDIIQRAFKGESMLVERQTLSTYHTLMRVVPLRDNKSDIFAVMFVLSDVSGLKEAQLRLAKINDELESKVIDRTDQLKEANKQLESFSYSVSHDLRAPLRSISSYAQILKDDYSGKINDPEFEKLADKVVGNARKMDKLISDLLDFSRAERAVISKTTLDMDKLVKEILEELNAQNPTRKVEIILSPLPPAEADANLMRQVWINLLSNAFKYSSKNADAKVEIHSEEDEGVITYSVRDNGAGFDMQFADKLFGVFQRMHRATEFEGTGVGLALVKSIITRHGGKIWAEAEVGKGATFSFTLPLT